MPVVALNFETVLLEMLGALRVRIAQQMQVPLPWVDVKIVREKKILRDQKLRIACAVNAPSKDDPLTRALAEEIEQNPPDIRYFKLTPEAVQQELEALTTLVRNEINIRIAGLDT